MRPERPYALTSIGREELAEVKTPAGTATHKPIPHITVVATKTF